MAVEGAGGGDRVGGFGGWRGGEGGEADPGGGSFGESRGPRKLLTWLF